MENSIIVLGAGVAGLALAAKMLQAGWHVTLLDHASIPYETLLDPLQLMPSPTFNCTQEQHLPSAHCVQIADNKSECEVQQSKQLKAGDSIISPLEGFEKGPLNQIYPMELRVSAINHASQQYLEEIQAWQNLPSSKISAYHKIHVFTDTPGVILDFDRETAGSPNLGYIVGNELLRAAIWQHIKNHPLLDFYYQVQPLNLELQEKGVKLMTSAKDFFANLIAGCDGANSWLRQQSQIQVEKQPYQHEAIVATIETQLPHDKTAYQKFVNQEVIAFLPLASKNLSSIVWSVPPQRAKFLKNLAPKEFETELLQAFGESLGTIKLLSERLNFPLYRSHAQTYISNRVALVGDAIHTFHPLAGQGLNLGLQDSLALANVLIQAKRDGYDPGGYLTLRAYERSRRLQNTAFLNMMDGFISYFIKSREYPLFYKFTQLGVNVLQNIPAAKNLFIRKALWG